MIQFHFLVEYLPAVFEPSIKEQVISDVKSFSNKLLASSGSLLDDIRANLVFPYCTLDTLECTEMSAASATDQQQYPLGDIVESNYVHLDALKSSSLIFWGSTSVDETAMTGIPSPTEYQRVLRGLMRNIFYPYKDRPEGFGGNGVDLELYCPELDRLEGIALHAHIVAPFRWKAWAIRSTTTSTAWWLNSNIFFNGAGGGDRG